MQRKQRNPLAGTLANPAFRQRKVRPLKGRGSYTRKGRSKGLPFPYLAQVFVNLNGTGLPR
ncbi:alternative ribosome-rescue factor A [Citromicrobium phage vB_CbaS-RXM]|nr:alternative ribosome-rescue factor A [Citromicrobium phage vB_CbaS-RXM]